MSDSLNVQRDDIADVVRVLTYDDGQTYHELTADHAIELGEQLIRAGRELQTTQAELPSEPSDESQTTLSEASADDTKPLSAVLDADKPDVDIGDVLNDNDPLEW